MRLHCDPELASVFVARHYRIGHGAHDVIADMSYYRRPDWFTKNLFNGVVAVMTRAGVSV